VPAKPLLVGVAGAGLFIAAIDAFVVVTLLPAMAGDVGLTIERFEQATPIVTGFLAGYVIAMPLLGAYSDVRGRAPVYAACMAAFAIGSVITATAGVWSFSGLRWLVIGRLIQGLGGGGLVPLSLGLAADLYRDRSRTLALGSVAALQEAGSVFGPLYGATIAAAAASFGGWRFVFWLNIPLAAVCAIGLLVAFRRTDSGGPATASSIDWISAALLGIGLGLLVLALYPDDPEHRATNALFIPAALGGLVVLGIYAWRQVHQLEPLIPRQLLRSRVPLLGRLVFNLDQLGSGLLLTQFLIGIPVGAVLGGWVAARFGPRLTAGGGIFLSALAFLQMSQWDANALTTHIGPLRLADVSLAACGLGFGAVIAPLTASVLALTRSESHGLTASLVVLARTMGMLVGLSALTAFGVYRFHQILGKPVLTDPDLRAQIKHLAQLVAAAFLQEYREIFTIAAGLCLAAAIVIVITIRPQSLRATAIR
jgi:MFS family permease